MPIISGGGGSSSGGGLTQSYVGYNTIGGSTETVGSGVFKQFYKKVTLAKSGLLTDIEAYAAGNGSSGHTFLVALFADSAGSVGDALCPFQGQSGSGNVTNSVNFRWMGAPVGLWLLAGSYWLSVWTTSFVSIAYDAGADRSSASSSAWVTDGIATSAETRSYSIRGVLLS